MPRFKIVDGPSEDEIVADLVRLITSANHEPYERIFVVNEGPELVQHDYRIAGVFYSEVERTMTLLPPVVGDDAPRRPTKIIYDPDGPEGNKGFIEIEDDDEERTNQMGGGP